MTYQRRTFPERIVCLTEETTELLYLLGEQDRIVGISADTERPPEAKRDKPVVCGFIGGGASRKSAPSNRTSSFHQRGPSVRARPGDHLAARARLPERRPRRSRGDPDVS